MWYFTQYSVSPDEYVISEQEAFQRIDTYESVIFLPQLTQIA